MKKLIHILLLICLFIGISISAAYLTMRIFIKTEPTVVVPSLVGKDVVYVLEILSDMGLNTKVNGLEFSAGIPKNHVIVQEPAAGEEIKKGRDVRIVISRGPAWVIMPDIVGLTGRRALLVLEDTGLRPGKRAMAYHDTFKKDEVIAQYPVAGSRIPRGNAVNLLVSLGKRPETYKMADLSGLTIDDALWKIESNHFKKGKVTSRYDEEKPLGVVIDSTPAPGNPIQENGIIDLVVNVHPEEKKSGEHRGREGFFRYLVPKGFLNRKIRVEYRSSRFSCRLFDDFAAPGTEMWFLSPRLPGGSVRLFEDNEPVDNNLLFDARVFANFSNSFVGKKF